MRETEANNPGRIKIRWVTYWPVPYWTERFNELAKSPEIELDVVFLSSSSELLPLEINRENWRFRYQIIRKERSRSGYFTVHKRIPKPWKLVGGEYDLLIMPYGDPDFVSATFLARMMGKPYALFVANSDFDNRPESPAREFLKRFMFKHAIGCLATGESQRAYAEAYMSSQGRVKVIGNPAPALIGLSSMSGESRREVMRKELGWADRFVVLYVGRLAKEKGLFDLIAALKSPELTKKKIHAVFIGNGPCRKELERYAREGSVSIEFQGLINGLELTRRFLSADVFILPSHSEPWGLVVNEAMEAGLPVIVSNKVGSGVNMITPSQCGLSFETGVPDSLASCISLMMNNEELRSQLIARAKKVVEEHSIHNWVNAVVESIKGLGVVQ